MWRVMQKMVLLCLVLILPSQGMAARLPHVCLYMQAQMHLARQGQVSARNDHGVNAAARPTALPEVPYQVCLTEKGCTWALAHFKLPLSTARLTARHSPGAASRFTSHILLKPHRPPRSFAV